MKENSPMSIPKGWIPLDSINKASDRYDPKAVEMIDPEGRLDFNLTLPPWLKSKEMILNPRRLLRMMDFAGISTLGIRMVDDANASDFFESERRRCLPCFNGILHNISWINVKGTIDKDRLFENIEDVRDMGRLAQALNKAVTSIIRREGMRHLLIGHTAEEIRSFIFVQSLALFSIRSWEEYLIKLLAVSLTSFSFLSYLNGKEIEENDMGRCLKVRPNLFFPGLELDIALVLPIYSRLPVIKALPTEEKDV